MRATLQTFLVLFLASYSFKEAYSARILAILQINAHSHFLVFENYLKALAARGHEVHFVSHFPQKTPVPNLKDINIGGSLPSAHFTVEAAIHIAEIIPCFQYFWFHHMDVCKALFEHPEVQRLMKSNEKYDLVVTEIFGVDCAMAFGHKFKAPIINIIPGHPFPWATDRVASPDNPSYIMNYYYGDGRPMGFYQRVKNTVYGQTVKLGSYIFSDLRADRLISQYFGDDVPSLSQLQKNVSLILVNSHFSVSQIRPLVPAMVEVAGLHLKPPKKLPQDIQTFLDGSPQGVIYFSLGSLIQIETFPVETLKAFVEAFRELPQRVLWKLNTPDIGYLPSTVKIGKWFPQSDILAHPNVRVFITHGGMMSTLEAITNEVPLLVIPFFGDQRQNAWNYKSRGMAEFLDPRSPLTKEMILSTLRKLLEQPSYKENAKRVSQQFRDRPQPPLETAVYWTEYVIRHRGAPHLKSAAVDLPLYQYLLLDVIAFLLAVVAIIVGSVWFIVRKTVGAFCKTEKGRPSKSSKVKTK